MKHKKLTFADSFIFDDLQLLVCCYCCSTKDPGQKPFTFKAGIGQVIAGAMCYLVFLASIT